MRVLLRILAVYRVAYLIANEDGPGDIATQLRTAVVARYGLGSWQYRGISCPLCVSFWLAWLALWAPEFVIEALGTAGGVLVVHRVLEE